MAARRKFKSKNRCYSYLTYWDTKTLFPLVYFKNSHLDFISNNLTSICCDSGGSFRGQLGDDKLVKINTNESTLVNPENKLGVQAQVVMYRIYETDIFLCLEYFHSPCLSN